MDFSHFWRVQADRTETLTTGLKHWERAFCRITDDSYLDSLEFSTFSTILIKFGVILKPKLSCAGLTEGHTVKHCGLDLPHLWTHSPSFPCSSFGVAADEPSWQRAVPRGGHLPPLCNPKIKLSSHSSSHPPRVPSFKFTQLMFGREQALSGRIKKGYLVAETLYTEQIYPH